MNSKTIILNVSIAAALLVLMAISGLAWKIGVGQWGVVIGFGIAGVKALLIAMVFMELRESTALMRIFAAAGLYWRAILIVLTLSDVLTRT